MQKYEFSYLKENVMTLTLLMLSFPRQLNERDVSNGTEETERKF